MTMQNRLPSRRAMDASAGQVGLHWCCSQEGIPGIAKRCLRSWRAAVVLPALLFAAAGAPAQTFDRETEIKPFAESLSKSTDLEVEKIVATLSQARVLDTVLKAISRPAEGLPWYKYRPIFLSVTRIDKGVAFWREHRDTVARAERRFGVDASVIVAIIGVETLYGQRAGNLRILDSLATLAFRYPKRAKFFRRELEQFLILTHEEGLDVLALKGSYAGAMGIPQFISSSYRNYAIDFDGDGVRDLINSPADAIGSVASYLKRHGWQRGQLVALPAEVSRTAHEELVAPGVEPNMLVADMVARGVSVSDRGVLDQRGALLEFELKSGHVHWIGLRNFYAITRYNHSQLYALAVHQLAQEIEKEFLSVGG